MKDLEINANINSINSVGHVKVQPLKSGKMSESPGFEPGFEF